MVTEVVHSFLSNHPADLNLGDELRNVPLLGAGTIVGLHQLGEESILATLELRRSSLQLRHQRKPFIVAITPILGQTDEHTHVLGVVGIQVRLLCGDLKPVLII